VIGRRQRLIFATWSLFGATCWLIVYLFIRQHPTPLLAMAIAGCFLSFAYLQSTSSPYTVPMMQIGFVLIGIVLAFFSWAAVSGQGRYHWGGYASAALTLFAGEMILLSRWRSRGSSGFREPDIPM
jgi:drug/metabolite transporter superfamily protein YnfA